MPSSILARADALMLRRRQAAGSGEVPILTDAIEDDDIPVLTEAETPLPPPEPAAQNPLQVDLPTAPVGYFSENAAPAGTPAIDPQAAIDQDAEQERFVAELTRRLERRLAVELPRLIEATIRETLAEQDSPAAEPPQP